MAFPFPAPLTMRRADPHLRNFAKSGGRTGVGREQRVVSDAGFWEVSLADIYIWSAQESWAYNAMLARLRQSEPMVFIFPPMPYVAPLRADQPVTLVAPAALRATVLNITGRGADLTEGQRFSIGDRLYQINGIGDEVATPVGTVTAIAGAALWSDGSVWADDPDVTSTLYILPPLRAAADAGAVCDFLNLRVTVELKDLADGDDELDRGFHGTVNLTLRETI